jgi:hypothetical protein
VSKKKTQFANYHLFLIIHQVTISTCWIDISSTLAHINSKLKPFTVRTDYLMVTASVVKYFLSSSRRVSNYQSEVKYTLPQEVIVYKGENLATFDTM